MLLTIANKAWFGWTYYKPDFFVRGVVDGNGRMVDHKRGVKVWESMTTLKYSDRIVIYMYCGSTSTHIYLKGSYDYFYYNTWPFKTYPVPSNYVPP